MNNISVVMSVYNAEDTIAETIESVLKQSFRDFEFIIVHDGSVDNIHAITGFCNDKRIRLIDNNSHDYIQSLNWGIKASRGKYIARIAANDIMHIDRLKLQHSIMEEFPDITVCSCWETVFGKQIPKRMVEQKLSGFIEWLPAELLLNDLDIHPVYMIRRSFITKHHLLYENCGYAEDYKFWIDIARLNGGFYIDSQPLVYRRVSHTKISKERKDEQLQSISKIKGEILHFLSNKYSEKYPALKALYNSYYELLAQELISENDIFRLFHSLFMRNKDIFKNL
ncbi:MAG: glycosyltransferase family 2 protein [Dysgonamonadaceae bacterium]|jgi:glycosyltransferase involved in cell wall biosynthesis|nr:glycosyltransferase family 2 protein [Dysgonamonadaceae bacterium]